MHWRQEWEAEERRESLLEGWASWTEGKGAHLPEAGKGKGLFSSSEKLLPEKVKEVRECWPFSCFILKLFPRDKCYNFECMVYLFIYFLKKRNIEALSYWVHWMDVARTGCCLLAGWDLWTFVAFLGKVGSLCLRNDFRLRMLKCFYGLVEGSRRRGIGGEKAPERTLFIALAASPEAHQR